MKLARYREHIEVYASGNVAEHWTTQIRIAYHKHYAQIAFRYY